MGFGDKVKGIAKADGRSLSDVASAMGISRQALYKMLGRNMSAASLETVLGALGYSLYYGKEGKVKRL